jgi:hypothetical protein
VNYQRIWVEGGNPGNMSCNLGISGGLLNVVNTIDNGKHQTTNNHSYTVENVGEEATGFSIINERKR